MTQKLEWKALRARVQHFFELLEKDWLWNNFCKIIKCLQYILCVYKYVTCEHCSLYIVVCISKRMRLQAKNFKAAYCSLAWLRLWVINLMIFLKLGWFWLKSNQYLIYRSRALNSDFQDHFTMYVKNSPKNYILL